MDFEETSPCRCVVATDGGLVEGRLEEGMWEFLGMPYAAPPVGDLRWKPPRPVSPWEGLRPCRQFGDACPQPDAPFYDLGGTGEDCLYLNVWVRAGNTEGPLPVMVWIHGGGFLTGSTSLEDDSGTPLYDGRYLAERGAVVVTVNYRLGPFGFLAHPLLSRESPRGVSGNYGLLDLLAALRWVKRNIASFGGDASRVTLFGESAGAVGILYLMVSPPARGLFERAIAQSAPIWIKHVLPPAYRSIEEAEEVGMKLARALGSSGEADVLADMRSREGDELISAAGLETGIVPGGMDFGPVIDGWLLPERPEVLFGEGRLNCADLVVGYNRDEAYFFLAALDLSADDCRALVRRMAGEWAEEALRLFPIRDDERAWLKVSEMLTAFEFTAPCRFVARCVSNAAGKAFLYRFTRVPAAGRGRALCVCHGAEIPYVFGGVNPEEGYGEADERLSSTIMDYWLNFAATGDPNGAGLPSWPSYHPSTDRNIELGEEITVASGLERDACDLAERIHLRAD